jgi:lysozyme family protein
LRQNFQKALAIELKYEGGFSNHPRDPGGVTLEGVIQRVYDGYRDRKGKPRQRLTAAMRNTPEWIAERNDIYRAQYWAAIRGDDLPAGVDLVVFDGAINSGPYQSAKWLQRALRMNDVDGHIGEATLAALQNHPDHDALIADILARRLGMLQSLRTWSTFGKGWSARLANARKIGQAWATGSVGPAPVAAHSLFGDAKAYASDVDQPAIDAEDATKGAAAGGSVSGMLQGLQYQLEPFIGTSEVLQRIYMGVVIAGAVIAVGGVIYAIWSSRKRKRAQRAIDGDVFAHIEDSPEALAA